MDYQIYIRLLHAYEFSKENKHPTLNVARQNLKHFHYRSKKNQSFQMKSLRTSIVRNVIEIQEKRMQM
jgi:hypothetical protein